MCQATTGGNNPTKLHSCETLHYSGFVHSYLLRTTSFVQFFFVVVVVEKYIFKLTLLLSFSQASPLGHHSRSHRLCPPDDQVVPQSPLPQSPEPPETGNDHTQKKKN